MDRISNLELKYVKLVLNSEFRGSKATNMVTKAEEAFCNYLDLQFSLGFVNGTGTLHTALETLGVGYGDEVIVPPLTMSATAFAVIQANATPVFADVDKNTFQIDAQSIRERITNKTKAIITVALYGGSPDYDAILSTAAGIPIIEDNAEAFGTKYKGRNIGSFGVFSSYSFQSSKHLTAGEGGMLCTNDQVLADKARKFQSLGYSAVGAKIQKISKTLIQDPSYLRHEMLGWNYRMSDLTAAVVRAQIERADELIGLRIDTAKKLQEITKHVDWLLPQRIYPDTEHSYWAAPFYLNRDDVTWHEFRDTFVNFGGKGIYAAWQLSYLEPAFINRNFMGRERFLQENVVREYRKGYCLNAEYLQPRILAFRTNEWSSKSLEKQLEALEETINHFSN